MIRRLSSLLLILAAGAAILILAAACRDEEALTTAATPPAAATIRPSPTPPRVTPSAVPASPTPSPTTPAPSPTAGHTALPPPSPTADPADHALYPYTIAGMRERDFPGGEIRIASLQEENEDFRRYYMVYPSDGLTITGAMNVPRGQGPFPVLILLHGYYDRDQYWTGADTWQMADFFARSGYLTIAPDYRSWGGSDSGPSFFHMGLVADVLNLISSLPSLPQADTDRVLLLGHSMGGGMATKVLVIDDRVSAAVLYAPNSADDADLIGRWGPGCLSTQSQKEGDECNPGEVIPADLPQDLADAYLEATGDAHFLQFVAPINYLEAINVPVQIHIGEADGEKLTQTPPEWSRKLYAALHAAGKEVEFFSYPGEGHYFEPPAWGEMINRALAFFEDV